MSSENHPDGYLRYARTAIPDRDPAARVADDGEIYAPEWSEQQLREQATRCMDCGVPTCSAGCPIGNLIPDWNDLVSRADWQRALERLHATNNFPELTGYACPAPCEDACTLAYNDAPVTIKNLERAIVDRGWDEGWIVPQPPSARSGFRVALVGSGPAGLAAAQQLNRAGHRVTVYERDDAPGGLVRYGLPEFKFAKWRLDRRIRQLQAEGIVFRSGMELGRDLSLEDLRREHHAVGLTIGAQHPRDVPIPGRELAGVLFAMPYLTRANRVAAGQAVPGEPDAAGRSVVVLGGGDTGADCVATALRQGAERVIQIGINDKPPAHRPADNPWPLPLKVYKQSYAQKEGGEEVFSINSVAFVDESGDGRVDTLRAERVRWIRDDAGRRVDREVLEPDVRMPADLVLIAAGFARPETDTLDAPELAIATDGTIHTDACMATSIPGVFAGGDAAMGHSLLVWAIGEGRDLARHMDIHLTGHSALPASLRTRNRPLRADGWAPLGAAG
ncbi:glutamate synthase subunit beta [Aquisalimonas lutea]|uniref:glutamate synthase subunit beta n=1 Tax=Aquisalimonas lutea TaxID=1327750 RepID=UPI0025B2CCDD|nr:glutamate synthase subunit beta [Aquisalimonas lutea]MDN3519451.1 glutamate synthase subunit beta [Aquisalimonas lutea]